MEVEFKDISGVICVVLNGRLDSATINTVETRFIAGVVPRSQPTIVDLGAVTFVASLAIGMLISAARSLARHDVKFALFGASEAVQEIFETNALSDIIPIAATQEEALAIVTA